MRGYMVHSNIAGLGAIEEGPAFDDVRRNAWAWQGTDRCDTA